MTCGSLGCGRQQFGGLGGNGHGLSHYESTGHGVSVKLGTITPEGSAGKDAHYAITMPLVDKFPDIYCYICNDAKVDLELASHLATFGINVQTLTKTEKSMTELASFLQIIRAIAMLNRLDNSKSSKTLNTTSR